MSWHVPVSLRDCCQGGGPAGSRRPRHSRSAGGCLNVPWNKVAGPTRNATPAGLAPSLLHAPGITAAREPHFHSASSTSQVPLRRVANPTWSLPVLTRSARDAPHAWLGWSPSWPTRPSAYIGMTKRPLHLRPSSFCESRAVAAARHRVPDSTMPSLSTAGGQTGTLTRLPPNVTVH